MESVLGERKEKEDYEPHLKPRILLLWKMCVTKKTKILSKQRNGISIKSKWSFMNDWGLNFCSRSYNYTLNTSVLIADWKLG